MEDNKTKEEILAKWVKWTPALNDEVDKIFIIKAMDEFSQQSTKHLQDEFVKCLKKGLSILTDPGYETSSAIYFFKNAIKEFESDAQHQKLNP